MHHHQPHVRGGAGAVAAPLYSVAASDLINSKPGKKRGSYNCGRCGLPKRGHTCPMSPTASTPDGGDLVPSVPTLSSHSPYASHLRRALSFDDIEVRNLSYSESEEEDNLAEAEMDIDCGGVPASCLWEILRRLPPAGLLIAARVCKGWRETTRRMWRAAEELRIRIPTGIQIGFFGSVLQKCPGLVRLSLEMHSDLDATMLACIAFSCPNLEAIEISMSGAAINRMTGDELGRFVADKRSLSCLKLEGCGNIGGFSLCSSSLSTLWLSNLHSLSKMAFNCPNLRELALDFCHQENYNTDLTALINGLGRSCPRLMNIHVASVQLSHGVVLALAAANFRGLRMLSLVLGSDITDASVATIASSYPYLELLDLSGSSISDSGIGMICNFFSDTLSRLLLALCPNITSSGLQFATAQLPLLELMDCGMSISGSNSQAPISEKNDVLQLNETPTSKGHAIYQKLIIKHGKLKKLSLWGCSGLDALCLNCPELSDLNLNSCVNLHPERLLLQCPNLGSVHASGCQDRLITAIRNQTQNHGDAVESLFPCKRSADGSKRIQAPLVLSQRSCEDDKKPRKTRRRECNVLVG